MHLHYLPGVLPSISLKLQKSLMQISLNSVDLNVIILVDDKIKSIKRELCPLL